MASMMKMKMGSVFERLIAVLAGMNPMQYSINVEDATTKTMRVIIILKAALRHFYLSGTANMETVWPY